MSKIKSDFALGELQENIMVTLPGSTRDLWYRIGVVKGDKESYVRSLAEDVENHTNSNDF